MSGILFWKATGGSQRYALLRDPRLSTRLRPHITITVPQVTDEGLRSTFEHVSVYCVASRDQARSFIGFKHINGPKKWDAYAKARFAARWYRNRDEDKTLEDIARAIGDRHATIKRMIAAIYVLDQARENELFSIEDRTSSRFNFSHLYTALSRSQYMIYLGLKSRWAAFDPTPNPVPDDKLVQLKEVLVWIYGSRPDDIRPVVRVQNPDIKNLGEVLASTEGLHELRTTGNLDAAHATTQPVDTQFTGSLIRARTEIRYVAGKLRAYDGQDVSLLEIAEDVKETAGSVYLSMDKKYRDANRVR